RHMGAVRPGLASRVGAVSGTRGRDQRGRQPAQCVGHRAVAVARAENRQLRAAALKFVLQLALLSAASPVATAGELPQRTTPVKRPKLKPELQRTARAVLLAWRKSADPDK